MNLKSKGDTPEGGDSLEFTTLIPPRHFRRPKVEGSTSARMRARFLTSLRVCLALATGLEIIVSIRTISSASCKVESWTEE
jgi:hypothetical protein